MTDTENEAVAKALETLRNEHADALDEWEAYPGRPMPAPLTSEDLARAAIRAIDAHRATVPNVITTVEELEALPEGTTIRDGRGRAWDWSDGHLSGAMAPGGVKPKNVLVPKFFPATVLTPTPEPTVKMDREAVKEALVDDGWFDAGPLQEDDITDLATFILALWPGRSEREVAEAAWDEGFDVGANTEEGIDTNPYRAKGASE